MTALAIDRVTKEFGTEQGEGVGGETVPAFGGGGGTKVCDVHHVGRATVRRVGDTLFYSTHRSREELDILRDVATVPVHLFEGPTDRQVHVLVTAFESGLLDVPTRARMGSAARRESLSRSTYGEHLRKAQRQLVSNSYPFLKLRDVRGRRPRARKASAG